MQNFFQGFLILFIIQIGNSQTVLKENQFEGYIVMKNGDKKEGIIEIGNISLPWSYQEDVKFFDKAVLSKPKVKKDDKMECKPGEVIEYGIGTSKFMLVEYQNMDGSANNVNGLTAGLSALKNATQTKYFAELFREGKISVYKFYNSPPGFYATSGDAQAANMDALIHDCKTKYDILIEKDGEKAKSFEGISIKKFFKDCEMVVKKYDEGKYTKKPVKGLKSYVKSGMLKGEALANSANEMIVDYEANCAK
jgi:hypothetical protein